MKTKSKTTAYVLHSIAAVLPGMLRRKSGHLVALSSRAKLINRALTLCTVCAILISLVIVALFISPMFEVDLSGLIAALFIGGLLAYVVALLTFLREIFVATASLRIGRV